MTDRTTIKSTYRDRRFSVPLIGSYWMLAAAIAVTLFFLGWLMFDYGINREGEIRRDSFNFQQTAREQVVDLNADLAAIDTQLSRPEITSDQEASLTAQRRAIAAQMCSIAADITGDTSAIVSDIITKEC